MNSESHADRKRSLAQRKLQLLREGGAYRDEILRCRDGVRLNMSGGALSKGLLGRIAGTAYAMMTKQPSLFSLSRLQSLAPILVTGVSILSKRPIRKSLFVGGILIAAASTAAYLSNRDKKVADNE
ncbi:hypothetical protein QN360_10405 [Glaciimonas sp. CA11.2]|uniref:hypothetical protein n=1 Tax=Glaciimonas sp. CA11.2 TaxID=3048601 RepID=UPI002AB495E0|nr:hypothetical protein [Glaciimonas sp. CA11.2]MDY7546011.1 hypothetical protein [Glaciimonas sp. CA11.2]MEB0163316.1 hypothetical protein [Glaciimonas sp. CA11.2]